jgi:hypothetical protein
MFKTKFTDAEWQTIVFAPLWAFSAIAGADHQIKPKEAEALAKELAEAALYKDEFTREVLLTLASEPATIMPAYGADRRSIMDGLREAADILDAKLPGGADQFKNAILLLCMKTAQAEGPIIGDKVSKDEKSAMVLVATMLRFHVPVTTV